MSIFFRFLLSLSFLFTLGCSGDKGPFPKQINLNPEYITVEDMPLLPAGAGVHVLQNYIVIFKIHAETNIVDVYDRESLSYIKSFGDRGGSENEISSTGFMSEQSDSDNIWITDVGRGYVRRYNIDSVVKHPSYESKTIVRYPQDLVMLMHFFQGAKGNIFYTQAFESNGFLLASFLPNSDSAYYFGSDILYDDPLVLGDRFSQNSFIFTKHPSKDLFACAYRNYDVLKIVDSSGSLLAQPTGPLEIRLTHDSPNIAAYRRIKSTKDYIYVEYVGEEAIDYERNTVNFAKSLHVFDWSGNHISIINLGIPIVSFDIDLEANRLVIISDKYEDRPIVTFNFDESELSNK